MGDDQVVARDLTAAVVQVCHELEAMLAASMLGDRTYDAMEWRRAAFEAQEMLRAALEWEAAKP